MFLKNCVFLESWSELDHVERRLVEQFEAFTYWIKFQCFAKKVGIKCHCTYFTWIITRFYYIFSYNKRILSMEGKVNTGVCTVMALWVLYHKISGSSERNLCWVQPLRQFKFSGSWFHHLHSLKMPQLNNLSSGIATENILNIHEWCNYSYTSITSQFLKNLGKLCCRKCER